LIGRAGVLATLAPAKVNLTLRVLGRRPDGFHDLESLVVFAPFGDRIALRVGPQLGLTVSGPTASGAGPLADNLVLRAAQALAAHIVGLKLGLFTLTKRLPAGAGLGGGSSDAAAALRVLVQANGLGLEDASVRDAARMTGADVPVCLDPRPRLMRGTGDILSAPLTLPKLGIVIVHPGIAVPTGPVFKALGLAPGERRAAPAQTAEPAWTAGVPPVLQFFAHPQEAGDRVGAGARDARGPGQQEGDEREALLAWLADQSNDLQPAAIAIAPAIADVLGAITDLPGCRLSRMSGSGSACFGLFDSARAALAASRRLALARPAWWVRTGSLGN
jgi:4-diphosphocytidyl-2-C-methyl-D-erythritol kinase